VRLKSVCDFDLVYILSIQTYTAMPEPWGGGGGNILLTYIYNTKFDIRCPEI
jgi:hypothetical protein